MQLCQRLSPKADGSPPFDDEVPWFMRDCVDKYEKKCFGEHFIKNLSTGRERRLKILMPKHLMGIQLQKRNAQTRRSP
jgi:hypothetical protein